MAFSFVDSGNSITLNLNGKLAVRLYRDNKPNCLETAPLQKGLVLVYDGVELIGEGVGFGVPVVKYRDKTVFSSTAKVTSQSSPDNFILEKTYVLDMVSRKRFLKAYINDKFYKLIHSLFEKGYLEHSTLTPANNKLMELREIFKIKTVFCKIAPRGKVTVRYQFKPNGILVSFDFSSLNLEDCLDVLVLNEQGADFFQNYSDSNGQRLLGRGIGAWNQVYANEASLSISGETLKFTLGISDSAELFRGYEKIRNRFSWAGLSYSLPSKNKFFDYMIRLG